MSELKFQPTYPCWIAAREPKRGPDGVLNFVAMKQSGGLATPVFTEVQLADLFAGATPGLDEIHLYEAKTGADLAEMLAEMRGTIDWVVFDPPAGVGTIRYSFRLEYVIRQVSEGNGLYGNNP